MQQSPGAIIKATDSVDVVAFTAQPQTPSFGQMTVTSWQPLLDGIET
jgi:hypothetical protein